MALPQEDKGVKKTPSDKDALPDRRKATPRNEELAQLIGEKISEVLPTKEETMEQNKTFMAMAGYLEILAGKAELSKFVGLTEYYQKLDKKKNSNMKVGCSRLLSF